MNNNRNNLKNWNNSSLQLTFKSPNWFAQVYKTWIILENSISSRPRSLNYYALLSQGQSEDEAFRNSLNGPRQTTLEEDSYRHNAEIQYNYNWEKLNLVVGTQYQKEHAFSNHTYLIDDNGPIILYQYGVYGQLVYEISETGLKLIFASRVDNQSLFGLNLLPKAGITYTKNTGTWRLTYGKGYLVPTLINTYQNSSGGTTLGNAEGFTLSDGSKIAPLDPESIKTLEIGYKNILFKRKLYFDADAYYNWNENLISPIVNIVPNGLNGGPVVTHRGDRPITDFTQGISPGVVDPGARIFTNINFGYTQTYGFDVGLNYYFSEHYNLTLNYSYFDYNLDKNDIRNDANADGKVTDNDLSINTPKNKISSAVNINYRKFYGTIFARWVQKYDFFSGRNVAAKTNPDNIYNGYPVIENKRVGDSFNYGQLGGFYLSANANYQLTKILNIGVYANNIFGTDNHEFVNTAPTETTFGMELKLSFH
jgi:iron complex outermembrane receptor protein